jgi:hypothetical protein
VLLLVSETLAFCFWVTLEDPSFITGYNFSKRLGSMKNLAKITETFFSPFDKTGEGGGDQPNKPLPPPPPQCQTLPAITKGTEFPNKHKTGES